MNIIKTFTEEKKYIYIYILKISYIYIYGLPKYLKTFFVLNRCRFIKFIITGALKNSVALETSETSYR